MSVEFVKVGAESAEILSATRQKVWATTYRGIYPDTMIDDYDLPWHIGRDRRRMEAEDQEFYLAMDGDRCVGYFNYGTPYFPYKDFSFCLNSLYFLEEYRGQGLGKRAFRQMIEACKQRGVYKFYNGCNVHNLPAQEFYRKMGGVVGLVDDGHSNKAEDQMYFEYYLGDKT